MKEIYDLIVIGGGAAGLTASAFIGEVGGKVALIEKHKLGGDCTWFGCVPSKALLKVAKVAHHMRTADKYGITATDPTVDMTKVKAFVQKAIHTVYEGETPEVFSKRGVEVIIGAAQFTDPHTIQVNDRTLKAKKIVIATGAKPLILPIPGLDDIPYHTNETLFDNEHLPDHLVVLGGGAIGMEMSQAYRRLGADVTMISLGYMPRDDDDARQLLLDTFKQEGIRTITGKVDEFRSTGGNNFVARTDSGEEIQGDMLLMAVGRAPTVDGLGLDEAGIHYSQRGIPVNDNLQTNIPHIYAVGDCTTGPKLTHYAGFQGAIAGQNIILPVINFNGHSDNFPFCTFTDPEVAQVGLTEKEARDKHGNSVKVFTLPLDESDRANAEGETNGFVKIVYKGGADLLGATVVAPRAGEMIQEFANAFVIHNLDDIRKPIHAYPTYSDTVKKAVSRMRIQELLSGTSGKLIEAVARVRF